MQSHHFPVDLKQTDGQSWGRSSKAFFATQPVGSAILFVHGFGGKATDTWLEFPRLLPLESESAGWDLLFYGYDGKKARAALSAAGLLQFLDELLVMPSTCVVNPSLTPGIPKRKKSFRYKRLIICAHSLGAIVSRLALLDAGNQTPPRPWLPRVRLLLFAPAHKGASIVPLISTALSSFVIGPMRGSIAVPTLKLWMPVLIDLDPQSDTLRELEARTVAALGKNYSKNGHLRATVIHGGRDKVVNPNTFVGDYSPPIVYPAQSHTGVCKPKLGFTDPLTELLKLL